LCGAHERRQLSSAARPPIGHSPPALSASLTSQTKSAGSLLQDPSHSHASGHRGLKTFYSRHASERPGLPRPVTELKKEMKNRFPPLCDKPSLRKRALTKAVNDRSKDISQTEHARHRSPWDFPGGAASGPIAYTRREKKPSPNIRVKEQFLIPN
jgi:hypothetical protein